MFVSFKWAFTIYNTISSLVFVLFSFSTLLIRFSFWYFNVATNYTIFVTVFDRFFICFSYKFIHNSIFFLFFCFSKFQFFFEF